MKRNNTLTLYIRSARHQSKKRTLCSHQAALPLLGAVQSEGYSQDKGSYVLEELDGTLLRRTYAGNRLKRFVKVKEYWYSPEDEVSAMPKSKGVKFRTDAELEDEAVKEFHEAYETPEYQETTQEIVKSTGVVVWVPPLPESVRDKYVAFPEE